MGRRSRMSLRRVTRRLLRSRSQVRSRMGRPKSHRNLLEPLRNVVVGRERKLKARKLPKPRRRRVTTLRKQAENVLYDPRLPNPRPKLLKHQRQQRNRKRMTARLKRHLQPRRLQTSQAASRQRPNRVPRRSQPDRTLLKVSVCLLFVLIFVTTRNVIIM